MKEVFQDNEPKKQAGVAIFKCGKTDFKPNLIRRDQEGCYTPVKEKFTKRTLQLFIYIPNMRAPKS